MRDISGWIEVFTFTYEAGPKQNEVKRQGSASLALGNIQYIYVHRVIQYPAAPLSESSGEERHQHHHQPEL